MVEECHIRGCKQKGAVRYATEFSLLVADQVTMKVDSLLYKNGFVVGLTMT